MASNKISIGVRARSAEKKAEFAASSLLNVLVRVQRHGWRAERLVTVMHVHHRELMMAQGTSSDRQLSLALSHCVNAGLRRPAAVPAMAAATESIGWCHSRNYHGAGVKATTSVASYE